MSDCPPPFISNAAAPPPAQNQPFIKILPRPHGFQQQLQLQEAAAAAAAAANGDGGGAPKVKRSKVGRACVPCAAARAKCGTLDRPCPRCVKMEITSQCVDKEHKKPVARRTRKRAAADQDSIFGGDEAGSALFGASNGIGNGAARKQHEETLYARVKRLKSTLETTPLHQLCVQLEEACDEEEEESISTTTSPSVQNGRQNLFPQLHRISYEPQAPFFQFALPERSQESIYQRFADNADEYSPLSWANLLTAPFKKVASFLGILGCYVGGTELRLRLLERFFDLAKCSLLAERKTTPIYRRQASVFRFCLQLTSSTNLPPTNFLSLEDEDDTAGESTGLVKMDFHSRILVAAPLPDFYVNQYPYLDLFPLPFLKGRPSANLYFDFSPRGDQLRVEAFFNLYSTVLWGYSASELAAILKQPPGIFQGGLVRSSGLLHLVHESDWDILTVACIEHFLRGPSLQVIKAVNRHGQVIPCYSISLNEFENDMAKNFLISFFPVQAGDSFLLDRSVVPLSQDRVRWLLHQ